jgi:hypothetical protein
MSAVKTLNVAIVVATLVGVLGFVLAQAENGESPAALRSAEASANPATRGAPPVTKSDST